MNILILTFYYPPDLSAGSFRVKAFVDALLPSLSETDTVEVVTTMPNRYRSYNDGTALEDEFDGRLRIKRIPVPRHRSGMLDQGIAFAKYAWSASRHTRGRQYSVVYATSSRLFTAFLGALCARRLRIPLYLDIRDIFADTMKGVLPRSVRWLLPLFSCTERYTIGSAARVNLVSEGFRGYFTARYPAARFSFFSNGIDEEFLQTDFHARPRADGKKVILYAGNIGEGQGLHHILPGLARLLGEDFELWVVGDGGRRESLTDVLLREGVNSVRIMPPVERAKLLELYRDADYLLLHLNNYEAFHKVLPSKIFEYAATGKPILAGVAGYSAEFIRGNLTNVAIFPPCDAAAARRALATLSTAPQRRAGFIQDFRRSKIMNDMAADVIALASPPARALLEVSS